MSTKEADNPLRLDPDVEIKFSGIPVGIDPALPAGTIQFRDPDGRALSEIVNLGNPSASDYLPPIDRAHKRGPKHSREAARKRYLPLLNRVPRLRDTEIGRLLGVSREAARLARVKYTNLERIRVVPPPRLPNTCDVRRWMEQAGYRRCCHCKSWLCEEGFYKQRSNVCSECAKQRQRDRRERLKREDPERLRAETRRNNQRAAKKLKERRGEVKLGADYGRRDPGGNSRNG